MPPRKEKKSNNPKPIQQRPLYADFTTQPPTPANDDLMAWMQNMPPDFLETLKSQYEKGKASSNYQSSNSSHQSQPSPSIFDDNQLQDQCDFVQSQFESQRLNESTPIPNRRNNGKGKAVVNDQNSTSRNYVNKEDEVLCAIVSNLSDKPKEQRGYAFWNTIVEAFNDELQGCNGFGFRTKESLTNRWGKLKRVARAWKAACEKIDNTYKSGFDEAMVLKLKKKEYCAFSKDKDFGYDHIIEHLSQFSKYNWTHAQYPSFNDNDSPRTPGSQGSGKRSFETMNSDTCGEEDDVEETSPIKYTPEFHSYARKTTRPDGVKKTKAKEKAIREGSSKGLYGGFENNDADLDRRIAIEQAHEEEKMALAAQKLQLQKEAQQRKKAEFELQMMRAAFETAKSDEEIAEAHAIRKKFYAKWANF